LWYEKLFKVGPDVIPEERLMEDERNVSRAYTSVGVAAVGCGVLGVILLVVSFALRWDSLLWVVLVLGILAIVFGIFAYWRLERDSLGLAGFGLGMVLVILWFLYYAYCSVRGIVGGLP
jgi:hypothetical protein